MHIVPTGTYLPMFTVVHVQLPIYDPHDIHWPCDPYGLRIPDPTLYAKRNYMMTLQNTSCTQSSTSLFILGGIQAINGLTPPKDTMDTVEARSFRYKVRHLQ